VRFKKLTSIVLLLLAGSIGYSSPPEVSKTLSADPGQLVRIVVKTPVDDKGAVLDFGYLKNFGDSDAFWGELVSPVKGERHFVFQAPTKNPKSQYVLGFFTKGETTGSSTTINVLPTEPVIPPTPVVPPNPVTPVDPLKTFRVIFVYESADTLTPDIRAIVYGKLVEDWMNANCTGGKAGWRRRDKDAPGDGDATMSALWNAVKPNITVTPCLVIERNGKADIVNIPANPTDTIALLTKYKGK